MLKDFILTNIKQYDLELPKNSYIFYSFVEEFKKYIIMIFETKKAFLKSLLNLQSEGFELFITNDFFILYKNSLPYYFQKTQSINNDELISFIKSSFNLKDLKVTIIDKNYSLEYLKDSKVNLLKTNKDYEFKIFISYFVLMGICILYFATNNQKIKNNEFQQINKNLMQIQKENKFKYLSENLLKIYLETNNENIKILSYLVKNSKISLVLKSYEKDNLYRFLNLHENSSIEKIEFNKDKKEYIANAVFEIN